MFALVEEMTTQREVGSLPDNSLAAFVSNALPEDEKNGKENGEHKKDMTNVSVDKLSLSSYSPTASESVVSYM